MKFLYQITCIIEFAVIGIVSVKILLSASLLNPVLKASSDTP